MLSPFNENVYPRNRKYGSLSAFSNDSAVLASSNGTQIPYFKQPDNFKSSAKALSIPCLTPPKCQRNLPLNNTVLSNEAPIRCPATSANCMDQRPQSVYMESRLVTPSLHTQSKQKDKLTISLYFYVNCLTI